MSSRLLEDYALLSDCHSAALVGRDGSVDWLAFPCFDSAACFAALLGDKSNGHWSITPSQKFQTQRRYLEDSLVLETIFETETGSCRLLDCMPYGEKHPSFVRILEGVQGKVNFIHEFQPRFDYGRIEPWYHPRKDRHTIAVGGPDGLILHTDFNLTRSGDACCDDFVVEEGKSYRFVLSWYPSHHPPPELSHEPEELVKETLLFWREWRKSCTYQGFDEESVIDSLMVLKALTYKPTGAIIAAPTTSLPELIGGSRNWDYRFSWIRDSSFALLALLKAGYRDEAREWKNWLLRAVAGSPSETSIMYGIRGERRLTEIELPWLEGYENSKPVRIGNSAHAQFQLDVFGEMLSASYIGRKEGIPVHERSWLIERAMVDFVCENWERPDEGIWEVRSEQKQFTHSKLMAWEALRYAVENVKNFGLTGNLSEWEKLRDRIHADICDRGFNQKLNSFVQSYESDELDASLLMMARVDFLPADDPRIRGTVKAIQKNLMEGGLVRRYRPESGVDGLHESEGCFIPCSFWLVDNLRLMGEVDEALELYRYLGTLKNDLGLYTEEYDVRRKRMVGNFPQGFSHIAHAISAMGLEDSLNVEGRN